MQRKFLLALMVLLLSIDCLSVPLAWGADSRVLWSDDGTQLGAEKAVAYSGSSMVTAMTTFREGVLTAFSGSQAGNGNRIHFSPNGLGLGETDIRYDGSSPVTAMIQYQGGVLTAFSNAGGNGNKIFFSP